MASIESFVAQIDDDELRARIAAEVAELKKSLEWGLVFERHLPETTRLMSAPIKAGTAVWERRTSAPRRLRVRSVEGDELVVVPEPENTTAPVDAPIERIARDTVLVEHNFSRPIFPVPASLGAKRNGPDDRPHHAVIQGENYHALLVLLAAYKGKVDVVYLDPPYNTGDRDWAYNNDYVDPNDQYRSSKWLAFMERRIRQALPLLRPDGVLVVTIHESEVHHLGMLLEQVCPGRNIQMVTAVINPKGVTQGGLSRVDEYIYFVMPPGMVLEGRGDDMLTPGTSDEDESLIEAGGKVRWQGLLHSGQGARRKDRASMFYPVLIDEERGAVVGAGEPMLEGDPDLDAKIDGFTAVWPIRSDGSWGRWYVSHTTLRQFVTKGYVALGGKDEARKTWALSYPYRKLREQVAAGIIEIVEYDERRNVVRMAYASVGARRVKTVWHRTRHDAGAYGLDLLGDFVGNKNFPFPKSLYSVFDSLYPIVRNRKDALIVDFFAGSGTTLHATLLVNARDAGRRRCILVTNNEVRAERSDELNAEGAFRGDEAYEAEGVFRAATRPRAEAAITGLDPKGQPVAGTYIDGSPYADGFPENVEFFELRYLDGVEIDLGLRYRELEPLLWLRAGGIGEREELDPRQPLGVPAKSPYAVLFDPSGMPELLRQLSERPDIKLVYIVAASGEGFSQMATELRADIEKVRLYREYTQTVREALS